MPIPRPMVCRACAGALPLSLVIPAAVVIGLNKAWVRSPQKLQSIGTWVRASHAGHCRATACVSSRHVGDAVCAPIKRSLKLRTRAR